MEEAGVLEPGTLRHVILGGSVVQFEVDLLTALQLSVFENAVLEDDQV